MRIAIKVACYDSLHRITWMVFLFRTVSVRYCMLQCGKYSYYCLFTEVTCKVLEFGCHQKNWKSWPWLWTFCCLFFSQPDLHLLKLLKWFNVSVTLIVSFSEYQAIRITGYFRPCHFDFFAFCLLICDLTADEANWNSHDVWETNTCP